MVRDGAFVSGLTDVPTYWILVTTMERSRGTEKRLASKRAIKELRTKGQGDKMILSLDHFGGYMTAHLPKFLKLYNQTLMYIS